MDRGAQGRIVRRVGKGRSALLLLALLLVPAGCHRYERGVPPPALRGRYRKSVRAHTPPTAMDRLAPGKAGMPPGFPVPRPPPT